MKKTELEKRLFEPKRGNFTPLKKAEVKEFLQAAAENRERLFQYTDLGALIGMLNGRKLRLTRGTDLNDERELGNHPKKAKRTFVASFCRRERESVAMWWLYGLKGEVTMERIPVRIRFWGEALRNDVEATRRIFSVRRHRLIKAKEPVWCDVIYQCSQDGKGGSTDAPAKPTILYDRRIVSGTRCRAFIDAVEKIPGYAKDGCWDNEEETRLIVESSGGENAKGFRQIAIPIPESLLDIEVCIGPGRLQKKYCVAVEERLKQEGFTISGSKSEGGRFAVRIEKGVDVKGKDFAYPQSIKLVDSQCKVRFHETKKKRKNRTNKRKKKQPAKRSKA